MGREPTARTSGDDRIEHPGVRHHAEEEDREHEHRDDGREALHAGGDELPVSSPNPPANDGGEHRHDDEGDQQGVTRPLA